MTPDPIRGDKLITRSRRVKGKMRRKDEVEQQLKLFDRHDNVLDYERISSTEGVDNTVANFLSQLRD